MIPFGIHKIRVVENRLSRRVSITRINESDLAEANVSFVSFVKIEGRGKSWRVEIIESRRGASFTGHKVTVVKILIR